MQLELDLKDWRCISTGPQTATDVEVKDKDGKQYIAHWASDLSGSEQPSFQGWFKEILDSEGKHSYYAQVRPKWWRPLNGKSSQDDG